MIPCPYNIVLVCPPGFTHSSVFDDLVRLLHASLQTLGHPCEVRTNEFRGDAVNIILNYHLLPNAHALPPCPHVIFQLEQLRDDGPKVRNRWLPLLAKAQTIWDYSPQNIAYLRSHGIPAARHVPLGFHPALHTIRPAARQDIDVLFYGSLTQRRRSVLAEIQRRGMQVHHAFGVYGPDRDALIARAKVVLNLNVGDARTFEQVRVSYLLNNRVCVVSEDAPDNPYPGMLVAAPYDDLPAACAHYVTADDDRRRIVDEGFKRFTALPMTQTLRPLLAHVSP